MGVQDIQGLAELPSLERPRLSAVKKRTGVLVNIGMLVAVLAIALVVRVVYLNQLGYTVMKPCMLVRVLQLLSSLY